VSESRQDAGQDDTAAGLVVAEVQRGDLLAWQLGSHVPGDDLL
jgi:hypothetical protein